MDESKSDAVATERDESKSDVVATATDESTTSDAVSRTIRTMQDLLTLVHGAAISRPSLNVLSCCKEGDKECYPECYMYPQENDEDEDEDDETKTGEQVAGCLQRIQEAVQVVYMKTYPCAGNIVRVLKVDGTCRTEDELWKMGITSPFGDIVAHKTRVDKSVRDARELPSTSKVTGFLDNPSDPMWGDLQKMVEAK